MYKIKTIEGPLPDLLTPIPPSLPRTIPGGPGTAENWIRARKKVQMVDPLLYLYIIHLNACHAGPNIQCERVSAFKDGKCKHILLNYLSICPTAPKINLAEFYWVYIWLITGINKIKLIKKNGFKYFMLLSRILYQSF